MSTELKEIDEFIKLFKDFESTQQKQRMRGLNDFNIFTTLRGGVNDEVRLHSRFLAFLLNPKANHYQDDLFLDLFLKLKEIGESKFFNNSNNCTVYTEHKQIDIYITDGNKHIIIENKIWAGDRGTQIKRYIEIIQNENPDLKNEDLIVIYLSPYKEKPSDDSLREGENGFKVDEKNEKKYLIGVGENEGEEYKFFNLHYNNQIKEWLEKSHKEIANIINLSLGITQYEEVIEQLYRTYKEKVMNLSEYLETKSDKKELAKTMRKIVDAYQLYRKEQLKSFLKKSVEELRKRVSEFQGWEVFVNEKIYESGIKWNGGAIIIRQSEDSKINFGCIFHENDFHTLAFGICRLAENIDLSQFDKEKNEFNNAGFKHSSHWWLGWKYYPEERGDLMNKIIADDKAVEKFVEKLMDLFENHKDLVIKCNKTLSNKEEQ